MKYTLIIGLCIGAVFAGMISISSASAGQLKPEDEIKFRQSGMTFMRWNMGKIKQQVSKPETYNQQQIIAAANVIAAVANSGIGSLFGPDTKTGKGWKDTRVKAEYFDQPEEVKKLASVFNKEAKQMAETANNGDITRIGEQFEILLKACKGCHKKFRSKD